MRIAVNASVYDRRPSGLGVYTRALVTALRPVHSDLVVYTSRPEELAPAHALRSWGEPSRGGAGHLWRLLWTQTGLPRRMHVDRVDVLLNTLPEGPLRLGRPQVSVVHDLIPLFYPDEFPRQQWYFRSFIPAVLRASSLVIADSAQTREDILDRYRLSAEHVVVVTPAVEHATFHPSADAPAAARSLGLDDFLLFVGNMRPHKNLLGLLDAFANVTDGPVLAVVGYPDPRYAPAIYRRVRELRLDARIRFLGFVPAEVLPKLYSAALLTVVPSLHEGFGLPVLEAMACGSPVVTSTAGGLREAAGDAALPVDPLDAVAMARALQEVISSSVLRRSMRERGLAHVRRFQWSETARRVLKILQDATAAAIAT